MNIRKLSYITVAVAASMIFLASCRKDPKPAEETTQTLFPADPSSKVKGLYVLNEGNMNLNKASLDRVDYTTGLFHQNVYAAVNPEVTKGLGDVANDMAVYGSKLYIVVNNSNKIEVLNARTGKRIKQIDLLNGRYITFSQNKAYVSAYLGTVGDPNSPNGIVAEIDTASLLIERRVNVGRQPEELAVIGDQLYVANSGGYSPSNYERTVSIVDVNSFKETDRIDVAINLERLKADRFGDLYVTSRGDYQSIIPKLFVISSTTKQIKKVFDLPVRNMYMDDDLLYTISTNGNSATQPYLYGTIDVTNETHTSRALITDGTDKQIRLPYGIAVNPITKDVLITDAKDYVTPGTLYCFDPSGKKKWQVTTGDIPSRFAFVY
ncbi:YncE family protein [Mucilaginibacter daejeonensis]|uniref:YncE family protein n=1 Tax=Mucilaginibacter daejeonensis TaxID=398049 RepID=UPI001D1770DD|nr:DUF5074 domain-containing protein [Mucilaginibacter daejeonensis]UEG55171.1 YncE family protein [Mucilaginibacter daejeonensis]